MSTVVCFVSVVYFVIYNSANAHARVGLCPHTSVEWPACEFRPSPELFSLGPTHQVAALSPEFRRFRTGLRSMPLITALLLVMSGVETNPGPAIQQGFVNARSIVNKGPLLQDMITSHNLDILAVCETWIVDDDPAVIKLDAVPAGYSVAHLPRMSATVRTRGGGLCIIHRDSITVKSHPLQQSLIYPSFECQLSTLHVGGSKLAADDVIIAVIYRPPSTSVASFVDDLSDLLVKVGDFIAADRLIMCGDFNCPGVVSTSVCVELSSLLDVHELQQFVNSPTRRVSSAASLLDLVIGSASSKRISQVAVMSTHGVSDHELLTWSFIMNIRPRRQVHSYRFRNLKKIDMERFKYDIRCSDLFTEPASTADEFADQLDATITRILDVHCPLQSRCKLASSRLENRWLSTDAVAAKRSRRRLERKWRSSHSNDDYVAYRRECRVANRAIIQSRHEFYSRRINDAGSNSRKRWSVIRDALHLAERQEMNSAAHSHERCQSFAEHFASKIGNLKSALLQQFDGCASNVTVSDAVFTGMQLTSLNPPSVDEVTKLIHSMPAKSSPVDALPTSIMKSCVDVFSPLIARLAALSFSEGVFPMRYKTASVTPLLKKKGLDVENCANYRPISNLHTMSKVVERLFLSRIIAHVEQAPCFNRLQSAYRRGHSTETSLLKLTNDIYMAADNKLRTLLIQLDLSAAFDTIDSRILFMRLERSFGLSGIVLNWIRSYIDGRKQFIRLGNSQSDLASCLHGVPQGSVLGPLLFSIYIAPIADVIKSFKMQHTQYADDTQLYITLDGASSTLTMNDCFNAVHRWFTINGLSLNPDKSEAIVVATGARHRQEGEIAMVKLGGNSIPVSRFVRTLGVTIDSTMSFDKHVDNVCKASFCHIRALRRIRKLLTTSDLKTVATAIVSSRLDYCNSLLFGITDCNINKLQRAQNSLARIVTNSGSRCHITPILAELHWLPVKARIDYKVALLTYKVMTTERPAYLTELLRLHRPTRHLRSSSHCSLHNNAAKTVFGSRAFCHSAPTVWNSLPHEITNDFKSTSLNVFKRLLKTHFYKLSFVL